MNKNKRAGSLQKMENPQIQKKIYTCQRCGQGKYPFKYNQCPVCNQAVDAVTYLVTAHKKTHFFKKVEKLGIEECFRGIDETSYP